MEYVARLDDPPLSTVLRPANDDGRARSRRAHRAIMMRGAKVGRDGIASAVAGPAVSVVTSSQTRTRNPAASISARIAAGVRRKLDDGSRAYITGKITGWTGPAIGSCVASTPPGHSARAKPR